MNELYTALVIAFVCAGIGFVGYVIGVVMSVGSDIEPERWSGQ